MTFNMVICNSHL